MGERRPEGRLPATPGAHHAIGGANMGSLKPSLNVVWSTDQLDLSDSFQHRWYIRQVLMHGRACDVRTLDLDQVAAMLDELRLPRHLDCLWRRFLEARRVGG